MAMLGGYATALATVFCLVCCFFVFVFIFGHLLNFGEEYLFNTILYILYNYFTALVVVAVS